MQPNVYPGQCWAFPGQEGYVTIKVHSYYVLLMFFKLGTLPTQLAEGSLCGRTPFKIQKISRKMRLFTGYMYCHVLKVCLQTVLVVGNERGVAQRKRSL